jgi:hypothetical protein
MRKTLLSLLSLLLATQLLAADARQLVDSTAFVIEEAFVDPARAKAIAAALRRRSLRVHPPGVRPRDRSRRAPKSKTSWQGVGVIPDVATSADEALGVAVRRLR